MPNASPNRRSRSAAILLWSCVACFAARVIGQFEVMMLAPDWLASMDAWNASPLPYYLLLPLQVLLLIGMAAAAGTPRVHAGRFAAAWPRMAATLRVVACLYLAVVAVRVTIQILDDAGFWQWALMVAAGHATLALFAFVSARVSEDAVRFLRMPAEDEHQDEESDDVPYGDVPGMAQPLNDGLRLRKQVGYRHAG